MVTFLFSLEAYMSSKIFRALAFLLCFLLCAVHSPAVFAEDEATPVTVIFLCEDENALPALHVFDQHGTEHAPTLNTDTGEVQYGHYLLLPGEYSYCLLDESERYEDFSDSITVSQAIRYIIPIDLTPVIHIENLSFTYIDPVYEGIIAESDIPAVSAEQIAAAEESLRELVAAEADNRKTFSAQHEWNQNIYYDTIEEAGLFIRSQIADFQDTATLGFCSDHELKTDNFNEIIPLIWSAAIAHTGNPTEGDYLRYEYGGYEVTSYLYTGKDGLYYYQIPFSLLHFTTAVQEDQLTLVVDDILAQLDLNDKSDYQKICAIYDYLCTHVKYGGSENLKYTAYSALINNIAYCQGYSTAFYRLCLSAGVDARIITSSKMVHAWNIAALDGAYYELDSTWDAARAPYRYFLKGSDYWLVNHKNDGGSTIGDQYNSVDFAASYPLPNNNYGEYTVSFDTAGGSTVAKQIVIKGNKVIKPADPVKDGYWFVGWYTDSEFKALFDFDTEILADTSLYARWAVPDFVLPSALTEISEEAFSGGAFSFAVLPEKAVTIGPLAFAECRKLLFIYIPSSVKDIDSTAFGDLTGLTILGASAETPTAAETFAASHGYAFIPLSK